MSQSLANSRVPDTGEELVEIDWVSAGAPHLVYTTVSLFRYAPALLILMIVIANSGEVTDPDLWGHLHFGQAVWASHHLARFDPYSYSAFGMPWRNHEWLTEVWMAFVYQHLDVLGLKLWKFGCAAATILFTALALSETGASGPTQLNLLIPAAVALMPQMQFRPQIFTFALFAALLWLLARYIYRGSARLWVATPMLALWANLHGGFIAGLGALAIFAATVSLQDLYAGRGFRRAISLTGITFSATLATLITPYGLDTWYAVIHALRNPMTRVAINDWQPLLFHLTKQLHQSPLGTIYYLCAILLMVTVAVAWLLAPTVDDLPLVAVAVFMTMAAFIAVRNMPLAVIACVIPAAGHLGTARTSRSEANNGGTGPLHSQVNQIYVGVLAAALALYAGTFSGRLLTEQHYPQQAVQFLQSRGLKGNILAEFGWGEYLIWHAPESKVFIDGRYDTVFPYHVINDYITLYFAGPGASRLLQKYPHDFILVPPSAPINSVIAKSSDWKLIYRDNNSMLFAHSSVPGLPSSPTINRSLGAGHQFFP
jgi:hypothetical protein